MTLVELVKEMVTNRKLKRDIKKYLKSKEETDRLTEVLKLEYPFLMNEGFTKKLTLTDKEKLNLINKMIELNLMDNISITKIDDLVKRGLVKETQIGFDKKSSMTSLSVFRKGIEEIEKIDLEKKNKGL